MALTIQFNKNNMQNNLNSGQVGFNSNITPTFVIVHLSRNNESLYAATRIAANEKGYAYV